MLKCLEQLPPVAPPVLPPVALTRRPLPPPRMPLPLQRRLGIVRLLQGWLHLRQPMQLCAWGRGTRGVKGWSRERGVPACTGTSPGRYRASLPAPATHQSVRLARLLLLSFSFLLCALHLSIHSKPVDTDVAALPALRRCATQQVQDTAHTSYFCSVACIPHCSASRAVPNPTPLPCCQAAPHATAPCAREPRPGRQAT